VKGWRPSQKSQPNAGNEIIGLEMTEFKNSIFYDLYFVVILTVDM
jgi:hypothetical protein